MKKLQETDLELDNENFDELGNELSPEGTPEGIGQPLELTDETITQEMINELKMLGEYKPPGVSWERWQRIQDIRPEHEHMIHLAASGVPQWRIAQTLGYDQASVTKILNTPEVRERVKKEIESIYGADHKKALKDRAMKAVGVVDQILESGKESEMSSMAKWVLEHSVGKASQDIQVTKTTLSEVIVKIEEMKAAGQLRDVGSNLSSLSKPKDDFDNIIEKVIPSGMIVGKRSGGESEEQS
jgi:hypothetical protein